MKDFVVLLCNKFKNVLKYPELVDAKRKKISTGFVKDLLFIKGILGRDIRTIFDIGAAWGDYTKAANYIFPEARIYSFEPIPESFDKLKAIHFPERVQLYNIALDAKDGMSEFFLNEFSFSSSLLKMTDTHKKEFPFTEKERIISVPCRKLESIGITKIERPCVAKIDVQGAELRVLEGAGDLINKFDAIQVEVNFELFYEEQAGYDKIFIFMLHHGFKKFVQIDALYSQKGNILASDLVFFK